MALSTGVYSSQPQPTSTRSTSKSSAFNHQVTLQTTTIKNISSNTISRRSARGSTMRKRRRNPQRIRMGRWRSATKPSTSGTLSSSGTASTPCESSQGMTTPSHSPPSLFFAKPSMGTSSPTTSTSSSRAPPPCTGSAPSRSTTLWTNTITNPHSSSRE